MYDSFGSGILKDGSAVAEVLALVPSRQAPYQPVPPIEGALPLPEHML